MRNNNSQIHFYLSENEKNFLVNSAKQLNLNITEYIRYKCGIVDVYSTFREQEEYEDYYKEQSDYCESFEEYKQREQEELDSFIDKQEQDDFEREANAIENDFSERLKNDNLTVDEKVLLLDGIEKTIEHYEQEINDYCLDEWVREPFVEAP